MLFALRACQVASAGHISRSLSRNSRANDGFTLVARIWSYMHTCHDDHKQTVGQQARYIPVIYMLLHLCCLL